MRFILIIIALLSASLSASAQDKETLEFRLEFSVKELDVAKPEGTLTCKAINKTKGDVAIPVLVEAREGLQLHGQGKKQFFPSTMYPKEAKPKSITVRVEAGSEATLFEYRLATMFPDLSKEPKYGWSWIARPEPPRSPIHLYRAKGFEEAATFWVDFRHGKMVITSPRVELKIKFASK